MEKSFTKARKAAFDLAQELEIIEAQHKADTSHINQRIEELRAMIVDIENLTNDSGPRDIWSVRKNQLKDDLSSLERRLRLYTAKVKRRMADAEERANLLGRVNPNSTQIVVDNMYEERQKIEESDRLLDGYIASGLASLEKLQAQKQIFKNARQKILDIANSLGLSNTIMKVTRRRIIVDRIIMYSLMVFTLLTIFLMWWYVF
eukprot:GCRY01004971.1.p1 GENE.GCRY01004971.1~~GCRY01004971.1.p1  ORF type:complete len:204 (-),score=27.49 GCRY01004971.1:93-704(-)